MLAVAPSRASLMKRRGQGKGSESSRHLVVASLSLLDWLMPVLFKNIILESG
ncbi:hypothetical protein KTAU_02690 [Thermogemmatispora aurantia]|uniref:Uncharacterized protein n=1 Tax=Thermogemmatispora aurantia TaxID=2045279 RepID=A0A5J4K4D9_9CHLR|nr:hypothetical protein KTAU_02690 [Thermogemmatispora aurantia]